MQGSSTYNLRKSSSRRGAHPGQRTNNKRPRLSEESPAMQNATVTRPRHHEDLYFSDGDVVLSVPDGNETVYLRLHRFMLSRHSPLFKDMFSLPTNAQLDVNEIHDGVPVVRMSDRCEDLAKLVRALYDPESLALVRHDPDVPFIVRPLLELAKKYQVDSVRTRIVRHLEADWPTDVWGWVELYKDMEAKYLILYKVVPLDLRIRKPESFFPEPASAIRLALDFDIPSILPAAFYRLAISDPKRQWGAKKDLYPYSSASTLPARWDLLEPADWRRYNAGKAELATAFRRLPDATCSVGEVAGGFCEHSVHCTALIDKFRKEHQSVLAVCYDGPPDVLSHITDLLAEENSSVKDLCPGCEVHMEDLLREYMVETWDNLKQRCQ